MTHKSSKDNMSFVTFVFIVSLGFVHILATPDLTNYHGKISDVDVIQVLQAVTEEMTLLNTKVEALEKKVLDQNILITKHERTIGIQARKMKRIKHVLSKTLPFEGKDTHLPGDTLGTSRTGLHKNKDVTKHGNLVKHNNQTLQNKRGDNMDHKKRMLLNGSGTTIKPGGQVVHKIAFSAYLSHDLDNMAGNQKIAFDSTVLNEGDSYNPQDGTFTSPVPGVYLFSFVVNTYKDIALWVKLVVNGVTQSNDVIWPHFTPSANMQGSNVVLLRLQKDDRVWVAVDEQNSGTSLHGGATFRATTFSGVFLYE